MRCGGVAVEEDERRSAALCGDCKPRSGWWGGRGGREGWPTPAPAEGLLSLKLVKTAVGAGELGVMPN